MGKDIRKIGAASVLSLFTCARWQSIYPGYLSIPLFRIYSPCTSLLLNLSDTLICALNQLHLLPQLCSIQLNPFHACSDCILYCVKLPFLQSIKHTIIFPLSPVPQFLLFLRQCICTVKKSNRTEGLLTESNNPCPSLNPLSTGKPILAVLSVLLQLLLYLKIICIYCCF